MHRSFPLVLLAVGLLPAPARAAAYYFTDSGTRSIGRGSAVIASVDDLSAQYHNPAALARLRVPQGYLNLTGVDQYIEFDRLDEPENDLDFETIENQGRLMAIPGFGVSSTFGLPRTTFALGFISPQAPDMSYPADGPQRYTLIDALIWQFAGALSVGHQVTDWLTVGAGFGWWVMRVEQELTVSSAGYSLSDPDDAPEDPSQDIDIAFRAWDRFTPSLNAGLLIDPHPAFTIGLSVQPPIHYEAEGSLTTDFEGHTWSAFLDGTEFVDDDITMILTVPLIVRGGVAWHPNERLDIEAATVFEQRSTLDKVLVTDLDLVIRHKEGSLLAEDAVIESDVELIADYVDAWSFRLGGAYDVSDRFTARLGAYHETSGIPAETQGVGLVDGNKTGLGGGGTIRLGDDLDLDFAVGQTWIVSRDITDSRLRQLVLQVNLSDPEDSGVTDGKVVGNGFFTSRLTFASVAMTWRFGGGQAQAGGVAPTAMR